MNKAANWNKDVRCASKSSFHSPLLRAGARMMRASLVYAGALATCIGADSAFAGGVINVPREMATIQGAIDAAEHGVEIIVAPGAYNEVINFNGKAVKLISAEGPQTTIIEVQTSGAAVTCDSGEGPDTILEGFSITNSGGLLEGAGMRNINSSPTVINCVFAGNTASFAGGMYNENSNPTLTDCVFIENVAFGLFGFSGSGGGMSNTNSNPTLTRCEFTNNSAGRGGGIYNANSSPTLTECVFTGNSAMAGGGPDGEGDGGGMSNNSGSNPTLTDCDFDGNSAGEGGGMSNNNGSNPTLTNCMFTNNAANLVGGGMVNSGNPTLMNCTFTDNTSAANAPTGAAIHSFAGLPEIESSYFCNNQPNQIVGEWIDLGGNVFCSIADLNGDAVVDGADLAILLANWGSCPSGGEACPADLDGDGEVDGADLAILLANWSG